MAKCSHKTKKPKTVYTLQLTEREAIVLRHILGDTHGPSDSEAEKTHQPNHYAYQVYHCLNDVLGSIDRGLSPISEGSMHLLGWVGSDA